MGLGSKERLRNRTGTVFCPREIGARAKIRKRGWGRGRKETLAEKPLDFENPRSPANGAREWLDSQTLLTCVDHMKKGMLVYKNFSPNKALISRELRQYGGNPVMQC